MRPGYLRLTRGLITARRTTEMSQGGEGDDKRDEGNLVRRSRKQEAARRDHSDRKLLKKEDYTYLGQDEICTNMRSMSHVRESTAVGGGLQSIP